MLKLALWDAEVKPRAAAAERHSFCHVEGGLSSTRLLEGDGSRTVTTLLSAGQQLSG